jgi:hypothetical protein
MSDTPKCSQCFEPLLPDDDIGRDGGRMAHAGCVAPRPLSPAEEAAEFTALIACAEKGDPQLEIHLARLRQHTVQLRKDAEMWAEKCLAKR